MITTSGKEIFKNGQVLKIRGYNYQNIPIGQGSGRSFAKEPLQLARDIADMSAAGVNCVRVYYDQYNETEYTSALNAFQSAGIDVIMFYYLPHTSDYSVATGQANRDSAVTGFEVMINNLKNHPTIIGWGIGDENNLITGGGTLAEIYQLVQLMCAAGKAIDTTRFYTTADAAPHDMRNYHSLVPSLDVWSTNIYRGSTLGAALYQCTIATSKPVLLAGMGYTRLDPNALTEREATQGTVIANLIREAESYYPYICGHLMFQFTDGWWKAGNNSVHDLNTEEWWGHSDAVAIGNDSARPKKAAFESVVSSFQKGYGCNRTITRTSI